MALPETLGHLVHIDVRGLFGVKPIGFDLELKEPTLLTGTNGSGKSTILKLLSAIGRGAWVQLRPLPFESAKLTFENDVVFTVTKVDSEVLSVTINGEQFNINLSETLSDLESIDNELIERLLSPDLIPLRTGLWEYRGRVLDRDDLAAVLRKRGIVALDLEAHEPLIEFTQKFHTLFVTDQRLVVSEDDMPRRRGVAYRSVKSDSINTAAVVFARDLAHRMRETLNNYAIESQRLDRDFPQRVVRAMADQIETSHKRLDALIDEIESESAALQAVGLVPKDLAADSFRQLPLTDANVMPVIQAFAEDTKKKFAVLADLRERLTLFTQFLNQHYENKQVSPNTQRGFDFEVTQGNSKTVPVSLLSSGEQQILVLAYEILFRAEPGTLVLIDEPELSLHVLWQDTFIDDITAMGNARNLQFILATHSPTLIGGRDDLKRMLDRA